MADTVTWLIDMLRAQAEEIAAEGHVGWGNTMSVAADALEQQRPRPASDVPAPWRYVIAQISGYHTEAFHDGVRWQSVPLDGDPCPMDDPECWWPLPPTPERDDG